MLRGNPPNGGTAMGRPRQDDNGKGSFNVYCKNIKIY